METRISKLCTLLAPKVLKYGNILDGMTMITARITPQYLTNFRPVFEHIIPIGDTDDTKLLGMQKRFLSSLPSLILAVKNLIWGNGALT